MMSAGFLTRFRTRAGLPQPTGLENIPAPEEPEQIDHKPGQDPLFKQVMNKQRQLAGEDDDTSDGSSYELVEPPTDDMSNDGFSIISNSEAANLDKPEKQVDSNKEEALSLRMVQA
jgi:hypothetical protein